MNLSLHRLTDNGVSTLGILETDMGENISYFYTLEDTHRDVKIPGVTRIKAGKYEIKLREEGKLHEKYKKKFNFHKGMLWLQNVPEFEDVYIHIGNKAVDTRGCILVGNKVVSEDCITGSTVAYINLYLYVIKAFEKGEKVFIDITDN